MQVSVTFRRIDASDALRNYAQEKLYRIKKYVQDPIEAHVVLSVEKFRHIAEVSINANGLRLNGEEETGDMYSAIDMVVASVLLSMGMMMLPPIMISLPFKLLLFVLVDGWWLLVGSLVQSFH